MDHVAVDLGASGGTVYAGQFAKDAIEVAEVYRFDNHPVERNGRYVWDVTRLIDGIVEGIAKANRIRNRNGEGSGNENEDGVIDTVGIDTWGLDFGLIHDGELLQPPYSYRDPPFRAAREAITDRVSRRGVFAATGINHWNTPNTLWQYYHLATEEADRLDRADRLLMMPQLLSWLLGGRPAGEATIASTTQMVDPHTGEWADELLDRLDLPRSPLPTIEKPGKRLGAVRDDLDPRIGGSPELVLPASHDTAAAVAGLPLTADDPVFLSTGTWFLLGVELDEPNLSSEAFEIGASNERGVEGTTRFLTNIDGFFLLEECRKVWAGAGESLPYDDLLTAARETEPFGALVDPDDETLAIEGEMPDRIRAYCERTNQSPPRTTGEVVRCVLESLTLTTAIALDDLLDVAGVRTDRIHVGGGGVRNELFCRMLAGATGRTVHAGPAEVTVIGNLLTQAVAAGTVESVENGRRLIERERPPTTYEPRRRAQWADAKDRMRRLLDEGTAG
jgi:rhamnulokinase